MIKNNQIELEKMVIEKKMLFNRKKINKLEADWPINQNREKKKYFFLKLIGNQKN
jgi:hypothetical protein